MDTSLLSVPRVRVSGDIGNLGEGGMVELAELEELVGLTKR